MLNNQMSAEFSVRIDAEAIARLRPDQAEALMEGMAKVLTATQPPTRPAAIAPAAGKEV